MIPRWPTILSWAIPIVAGVSLGLSLIGLNSGNKLFKNPPPLSPLGQTLGVVSKTETSAKQVVGFLPYWSINSLEGVPAIDQLVFFGVKLSNQGEIITRETPQEAELGWYTLKKEPTQNLLNSFRRRGVKVTLAVTAFDNQLIDALIHDKEVKDKALKNIAQLVEEFRLDGVNIDFEYKLHESFAEGSGLALAEFVEDLREKLKQNNPQAWVSVDVYVNSIIYDEPYDVAALSKAADQVIVMAYDFHSAGSSQAGPVAPLRSTSYRSIIEGMEVAMNKSVDLNKLVLGIPLYGYEWPTETTEFRSPAVDRGVLATHKRIAQLVENKEVELVWDQDSLSPWLWYKTEEEIRQIYYDNDRSIGLKLQLADQLGLQGVAFWALGYEGDSQLIWQLISSWRHN